MPHTRAPRGRNSANKLPPLENLLPEKVRIQFLCYNPRRSQYHSLSPYHVKVIVRNKRELDRLFAAVDAAVRNLANWQD